MKLLKREIYSFALACINLYGLIPLRKLTSLLNHYYHTEYETKDVEEILKGYITEEGTMQLVGRILYQNQIFENTNVRDVYEVLKDKPYYMPETVDELLNYMQASYYELPQEFEDLKAFYTKWTENENNAFIMAKDAIMAFNVDCPVMDLYEIHLARLNDFLNLIESKMYLTDVSRAQLLQLMVQLNHKTRKISLRGYSPADLVYDQYGDVDDDF